MAKFSLEIDCDNDAFAEHGIVPELRRLLKVARWTIGHLHHDDGLMFCTQKLFDKNGNAVGVWHYQPNDEIEAVIIPVFSEVTSETSPDTAPGTSFLGNPPAPKSRVRRRYPGEPLCPPPDTPSLDTSFHDHEMDVNDDRYPARRKRVKRPGTPQLRVPVQVIPPSAFEVSEADEVAANMSLETITTWDDAKAYARQQMPDESGQVIDNVADALMARRDQEVAKTFQTSASVPVLPEELRERAQIISNLTRETRWLIHTAVGWRIKTEPSPIPERCVRIDPVKRET